MPLDGEVGLDGKYHYVYLTKVLDGSKAGHYYYGKHTSLTPFDAKYNGSGVVIKLLKKAGRSMTTVAISYFQTSEMAGEFENLLVDVEMLQDPLCLNKRVGGVSGCVGFCSSTQTKSKISTSTKKAWEDPVKRSNILKSRAVKQVGENHPHFKGWFITPFGVFESTIKAAEELGISRRTIYNRCRELTSDKFKEWDFLPVNFNIDDQVYLAKD